MISGWNKVFALARTAITLVLVLLCPQASTEKGEVSTRNVQTVDDNKGFVNLNRFIPTTVIQSAPQISDLMESYIRQHSEHAARNDPNFCDRQFIVAVYGCPRAMGNHMMEFLSAFLVAAVTNRTVVWSFCDRRFCDWDNELDCEEGLHRFHWLMSFETAKKSWSRKKCPNDLFDGSNWHMLYDPRLRGVAEEIVSCCPIEGLPPYPFMNVGINNFMEMYAIVSQKALLLPESRRRADILSAKGAIFLFGFLFRSSFRFQESVIRENDRLLSQRLAELQISVASTLSELPRRTDELWNSSVSDAVGMVGIHLRHADPWDKGTVDNYNQVSCLTSTIARAEQSLTKPVTVILFASDREQQLLHWEEAHHFPKLQFISSNHTAAHQPEAGYFLEHGTRAGAAAFQDLELLSRSHFFIGSRYFNNYSYMKKYCSTFSMLIACLQATNGFRPAHQDQRSVFLHKCDSLMLNRDTVPPMFDDQHSFQCTKKSIKDHSILMPNDCPNFVDM